MKIRLLSDLHLESNRYLYEPVGEDVLVLAGDIHTQDRHRNILDRVPKSVRVFMVAGNHEYYRGEFCAVNAFLKSLEKEYPNFTFLNDSDSEIDGVPIFGGTMFTGFDLTGNPLSEYAARNEILDFRIITHNGLMWSTIDHKEAHQKFTSALTAWLKKTKSAEKRIVVSHFVPCPQVIHPRWRNSSLNPYFTADMTKHMGWKGLWLYGHTHDCGNASIGDTEVWGNPYGYGNGSENPCFNNRLLLEI